MRRAIRMRPHRIPPAGVSCSTPGEATSQNNFVLDNSGAGSSSFVSFFDGVNGNLAAQQKVTPYITVAMTVKPVNLAATNCTVLPNGSCYKVETTLNLGGI